jgi:hypothetical protein
MLASNRYALKEWETVCERLGRGEDVLVLRKGGILERRAGFQVEHREFFLFPTRFHGTGEAPPPRVDLRLYAGVEDAFEVTDLARLRRLDGWHALPWADVEHRFHYGDRAGVHALVVRAWRLAEPHPLDNARAYDGCRSWVELAEEVPVRAEEPCLGERAFEEKRRAIRDALHG